MTAPLARGLRAAGALVVLLAVIVGVPALLFAMRLVPHGLPSVDQIVTALRSRDDGQLAGIVLAAGVWVCWALFTASTAAEIVALARSRPVRRLPGLRVFQRPAAALLTAVAVGFTIAPMAVGGASPSSRAPLPPLPVATAAPLPAAQPLTAVPVFRGAPGVNPPSHDPTPPAATKAYVVQRRDTLWALAERYLGDPLRYPEIIRLNPTAVGPDSEIRPGTVLTMPNDAAGLPPAGTTSDTSGSAAPAENVTVRPGDTLWGLTEQVTGEGQNWPRAWATNRGRPEPAGARFTDPSLIRPGWTLTIPDPDGAEAPPTPPPPTNGPPSGDGPAPPSTPSAPTGPAPATSDPSGATEPSTTPAPVTSSGPTSPGAEATPGRPPAAASGQSSSDAGLDLPMLGFTGGGLLLAGLSLTALLRYRRRQFRHRRPGRMISSTPPELARVERAVYTAGNAGIADVTWLDQALRSLAQTLSAVDGGRLPDVIAARLTDDVLTLILTEPSPDAPQPWTVDAAGTRWSIRRGDRLPYDEQRRAYHFAPYPTLASIGSTADGEHWLLDLERAGAVTVSGDTGRCLDLARFLAAELAHNSWSEMLQVTLVGFGEELIPANPDRLTFTDDVDRAVTELGAQLASVTDAVRVADVDVLAGRLHDIAGDMWAPHVVLVAGSAVRDHAGLRRLLTEIGEPPGRSAVALLVFDVLDVPDDIDVLDVLDVPDDIDDVDHADAAGWQLTLDGAGTLPIPALGVELTAHQLPAAEAAQLAQLLAAAAVTDDRPIPPARGNQPWDAHADACGGLRIDPTPGFPAPGRTATSGSAADIPISHPAGTSPQSGDSLLPLSAQTYLDRTATTEGDLRALAPATGSGTRRRIEAADPTLDADLADWADPGCSRPKLTLLGPVQVRAGGSLPERNPRRAFCTEIVAYLATRPTGATGEQYAGALWADEPDVLGKTKVRQSVSVVRGWLGTDRTTGREYLPAADAADRGGRYRIDGVLIDAELFRRLRARGQARGADGIADLRAALDLVTGEPFGGIPAPRRGAPGGYRWLIEDNGRLDHEYAAMIVDVAHTVATHHLAAGEPGLAADAARVALRAGSFEDVPLLDLVAACDAQDHRAEADAYVARILANHDAEVEEDLPPRTAEILFRRRFPDAAG